MLIGHGSIRVDYVGRWNGGYLGVASSKVKLIFNVSYGAVPTGSYFVSVICSLFSDRVMYHIFTGHSASQQARWLGCFFLKRINK